MRHPKPATCHPDRKHKSQGLCDLCYYRLKALRTKYGISLTEYNELYKKQDGLCAICLRPEPTEGKRLGVDHNHITKAIRGLLCSHCNPGIGQFGESIELLQRAIAYLERHK